MRGRKSKVLLILGTALLTLTYLFFQFKEVSPDKYNNALTALDCAKGIFQSKPSEFSKTSHDLDHMNYKKRVFINNNVPTSSEGSVLIASSLGSEQSFGKDRSVKDFYIFLQTLEYDTSIVSLALYCGTESLFNTIESFFDDLVASKKSLPYARVTLLHSTSLGANFKTSEHKAELQRDRRRTIARARNFVVINALDSEQFILFVDADIYLVRQKKMLKFFVESKLPIIVPRVQNGDNVDYDKNSWRGSRTKPSSGQLELMDKGEWKKAAYVPKDVDGMMYHLEDHLELIKALPKDDKMRLPSYAVELDSVGGAILFMHSMLFRQGIIFPTINVVGTAWERDEGFDGIETEGVCYLARTMGYRCHGMPNLVAQHVKRSWF